MKVPDTLEGAFVLSLVDFVLSFVFIGGIGVMLALFPQINKLGKVDESKLSEGH